MKATFSANPPFAGRVTRRPCEPIHDPPFPEPPFLPRPCARNRSRPSREPITTTRTILRCMSPLRARKNVAALQEPECRAGVPPAPVGEYVFSVGVRSRLGCTARRPRRAEHVFGEGAEHSTRDACAPPHGVGEADGRPCQNARAGALAGQAGRPPYVEPAPVYGRNAQSPACEGSSRQHTLQAACRSNTPTLQYSNTPILQRSNTPTLLTIPDYFL